MLLYEPRNWEDFQQYYLFTPHFLFPKRQEKER